MPRRAALICIDGWGVREEARGNAILAADTPVMDGFRDGPAADWAVLEASGLSVGLPEGVMGNSEVGHLTIGAGQVEFQDLVRINLAVESGSIDASETLAAAFELANKTTGRLHLFGMLSDAGVHSKNTHLYKLLELAKAAGVPRVLMHICTDGRDTPPTSGPKYVAELEAKIKELGFGEVSSLSGRYYAMDRDKRWDRVQLAYDVFCRPDGACETVPCGALAGLVGAKHEAGETDEFIKPVGVLADGGIKDNDVFMCFNFRSDRAREMFEAISVAPPWEHAPETRRTPVACYQFTKYNSAFSSPIVFAPQTLANGLSEWISKQGLTQYHVAETEKYAHVTFFFNGGREEPFEGEEREMVPSPKVATYDLQPEMNAAGVADAMEKAIISAAVTDREIGKIAAACKKHDVGLFITSDHGNCDTMLTADNKPVTSHSTTPVPFAAMAQGPSFARKTGGVADVAPTILAYMGLPIPPEMTGKSFY